MHTERDADCPRALTKHVDRLVPVALQSSGLDKENIAPPAGFHYAGSRIQSSGRVQTLVTEASYNEQLMPCEKRSRTAGLSSLLEPDPSMGRSQGGGRKPCKHLIRGLSHMPTDVV